jgi:hypothetical protein
MCFCKVTVITLITAYKCGESIGNDAVASCFDHIVLPRQCNIMYKANFILFSFLGKARVREQLLYFFTKISLLFDL